MYSGSGRWYNLDSAATELAEEQHDYEASDARSRKIKSSRSSTSSRKSLSRSPFPNFISNSDGHAVQDFGSEQKQAPNALSPVPDFPNRVIDQLGGLAVTKKSAIKPKTLSISPAFHALEREERQFVKSPEGHGTNRSSGSNRRRQTANTPKPQENCSNPPTSPDIILSRRLDQRSKQNTSPAISFREDNVTPSGLKSGVRGDYFLPERHSTSPRGAFDLSKEQSRKLGLVASKTILHGANTEGFRRNGRFPAGVTADGSRLKNPSVLRQKDMKLQERKEASNFRSSPRMAEPDLPDQYILRPHPESTVSPRGPWQRSSPSPSREDSINPLPEPSSFISHTHGTPVTGYPPSPPASDEPQIYDYSYSYTPEGRDDVREKGRRRSKSMAQPVPASFDSTPLSSGVGHYITASDFSSDQTFFPHGGAYSKEKPTKNEERALSNGQRHQATYKSKKSSTAEDGRPNTTGPNITSLRSARLSLRDHHARIASSSPHEKSDIRNTSASPIRSETANRYTNGGSQSPLMNIRNSAKTPMTEREGQNQHIHYNTSSVSNPTNLRTRLRNDDSMTYVAITASGSSPQSGSEAIDYLSDASEYPDKEEHDAETLGGSPYWPEDGNAVSYLQAVRRREALLTGLGLGLSNVETDNQVIEVTYSPNEKTERQQNISFGVASSYSYEGTPNHETGQGDHPTPRQKRISKSKSHSTLTKPELNGHILDTEWDHTFVVNGEKLEDEIDDTVSRDNPRRNTWVYDGSDLPKAAVEREQDQSDDNRDGNLPLTWSDNDSLDEPLSENAQRMFDSIQQESVAQEGENLSENRDEVEGLKATAESHRSHATTSTPNNDLESKKPNIEGGVGASENSLDADLIQSRTWRNTVTGSAYNSLLEKHGIAEMKRQDVIFELCETEITFVKSMKVIQRLFADPLKSQGQWFAGLSEVYTGIFDWLDDIIRVHSNMASALHSARSSQFPMVLRFAEHVRPFIPRLKAHQPYLVHLEGAIKEIDGLLRDPQNNLGEFIKIQSSNEECRSMSLTSFLLQPMQRLTKYPLFFKQLWEMTPRNHPDHLSMFSLYTSTHLMITVMQEVKTREEEFNYVKELASRISGFPPEFCLAQRERRLIAQGLLRRVALSEKDRDTLDGLGSSTPHSETSLRPVSSLSPIQSPQTPSFPNLAKLGPITSPLFPAYHSRAPVPSNSSPYSPRRSYMSAVSRASTALSEATRMSEWTASYSPTSSINISSDLESRPDSSMSTMSGRDHSYGSSQMRTGTSSIIGSRSKTREMPVYAFVFTDLVLFTTQTEKHGLFQSKSPLHSTSERMSLVDNIGISRILGVADRSVKLADYNQLLEIDLLPMTQRNIAHDHSICSVFLTLPSVGNSRVKLKATEELSEAKDKWLLAFDRCYGYTLRALSFPSMIELPPNSHDLQPLAPSSVMSLLSSGLPLPKNPSYPGSTIENQLANIDRNSQEWWSHRFTEVLRDIEHTQDAPVMLIGDGALMMGRGLKKINTSDRTRRNGPQQLLLPTAAALNSPSVSSSSGSSRKNLLGIRKR